MDKVYKLKDVPKGQRLRYFFDYNFLPIAGAILAIIVVVLIVKFMWFSPKEDYGVILVNTDGEEYLINDFHAQISQRLDETIGDVNQDGKNKYTISYSNINEETAMSDPEYYSANVDKYYAEITVAKSLILIGDEEAFARSYIGEELCAKNDDFEFGDLSADDTYLKIPLTEIESMKDLKYADRLFISIRSKADIDMSDDSKAENYNNHVKALKKILGL